MWVLSILSGRVKYTTVRAALSAENTRVEPPDWETHELAETQPELARSKECYQDNCWGWFLMKEEVSKGKCLAPSVMITVVQLTLKSSTAMLLAERSWVLVKARLQQATIGEYSCCTLLTCASFPAWRNQPSLSLELEAGHLLLAQIKDWGNIASSIQPGKR